MQTVGYAASQEPTGRAVVVGGAAVVVVAGAVIVGTSGSVAVFDESPAHVTH
jgi:hypothetical protein